MLDATVSAFKVKSSSFQEKCSDPWCATFSVMSLSKGETSVRGSRGVQALACKPEGLSI